MSQNRPEDTQSISLDDPRFQAMLAALEDHDGTATLSAYTEILLVIDDMIKRLMIQDNKEYYLGRFSVAEVHEIDLNPYGALQHGVSRVHAKLIMNNNRLYIMDLSSSNGTYVRRKRLHPHKPALITKGDEILLGRMRVQVLFR